MKLWLLRPREDLPRRNNPWDPPYDKKHGFVIRADTEQQARELAHHRGEDENRSTLSPWLLAKYSTCTELTHDGETEVILEDFTAG